MFIFKLLSCYLMGCHEASILNTCLEDPQCILLAFVLCIFMIVLQVFPPLSSRLTYLFVYMYFSYALLTPETYPTWNGRVQDGVKHLLLSVNMEPDQWQLGKTKIFIKSPESVGVLHVCLVCTCNILVVRSTSVSKIEFFWSIDCLALSASVCFLAIVHLF